MKVLTFLWFFLLAGSLDCQNENAQWRFGFRAGLNFLGSPPAVTSGSTNCSFSSASQSDSLGNLLFYVEEGGMNVYNKNNQLMASNLGGDGGPQSGWIIPKGGSEYYIVMHNGMNYFAPYPFPPMTYYAVVDMSLASGLGAVTLSAQPISAPGLALVSKMAVSKHCNGKDYWILRHSGGFPGANFYMAYLLTSSGFSSTPVISQIGSNQPQAEIPGLYFYTGMHKFSPNGRKVAATMPDRTVELYDFNPSTGQLSNVYKLDSVAVPASTAILNEQAIRGLEFSPDGSKLYVSYINKHPHICQFDLSLGSISAIRASKTVISQDTITASHHPFSPQLAHDGKIYVVGNSTLHLGVIPNPNLAGVACGYSPQAIYIGTTATFPFVATPGINLPNCMASFFEQKPTLPPITSTVVCGVVNYSAPVLSAFAGYSVSSYYWNFNDPLSAANTSSLANPLHAFSANGTYTVKLALNYHPCGTDTLKQVINITGLPDLSISGKTNLCRNESTLLSLSGASQYSLNGNALSQSTVLLQPTVTTVYTLSAKDNSTGCSSKRSFTITVFACAGLNENGEGRGLRVAPNPNQGCFTLESECSGELKLINALGQKVYQRGFNEGQNTIEVAELPKGIYILEWSSKEARGKFKLLIE